MEVMQTYLFQLASEQEDADSINAVAWSPDGKYVVSSSNRVQKGVGRERVPLRAVLHVWDAFTGEIVCTYPGHRDAVVTVAWSPDGQYIASGGWDHTVQVWRSMTGEPIAAYTGQTNIVCALDWSPDSQSLVSAASDLLVGSNDQHASLHIWSIKTGESNVIETEDSSLAVAWSPDGTRIASGGVEQTIHIWDAQTGHQVYAFANQRNKIYALSWSPDSTTIASGGGDNMVQVWNAENGEIYETFPDLRRNVSATCWSPDGHFVAATSDILQIWEGATGKKRFTFGRLQGGECSMRWHTDNLYLARLYDTKVRVWQIS